jgi:hypothetical protein
MIPTVSKTFGLGENQVQVTAKEWMTMDEHDELLRLEYDDMDMMQAAALSEQYKMLKEQGQSTAEVEKEIEDLTAHQRTYANMAARRTYKLKTMIISPSYDEIQQLAPTIRTDIVLWIDELLDKKK